MAFFLTVSLIGIIKGEHESLWSRASSSRCRRGAGRLGHGSVLNRIKLQFDGLYPVLLLALMMFTFAATDMIGGNGFLAVYLAGVVLGNSDFIHKKSLIRFYDGQAWLVQIVMFLTLGLLVFPKQVVPVMGTGLLISVVLIVLARPVAVFVSLSPFRSATWRQKTFLSWVGLRGAVPIVFATYPLIAGLENAQFIFNVVFFAVLTSVLLQGSTLPLAAKLLRVERPKGFQAGKRVGAAAHRTLLGLVALLTACSGPPDRGPSLSQGRADHPRGAQRWFHFTGWGYRYRSR